MDVSQNLPDEVKMGLQCLNQGAFYEAHEYFEDAWRQTSDGSREFFRALLHVSGGFFRLEQGRAAAAHKFFNRALHWLQNFPIGYLGFDVLTIKRFVENLLMKINDGTPVENILEMSQPFIFAVFYSDLTSTS